MVIKWGMIPNSPPEGSRLDLIGSTVMARSLMVEVFFNCCGVMNFAKHSSE